MSKDHIAIKHGSTSVENACAIGIDQEKINFIVRQHVLLRAIGVNTSETASGAIVAGTQYAQEVGLSIEDEIELARMGTWRQMTHFGEACRQYGLLAVQALFTNKELDDPSESKIITSGMHLVENDRLLVVINENPFASAEETKKHEKSREAKERGEEYVDPDNDILAAHAATENGAKALLLLSNVNGFRTRDGKLLSKINVDDVDDMIKEHCVGKSDSGKGGMKTKLLAAKMAALAGIEVVIANAFNDYRRLLEGRGGTRVVQ